MTLLVVGQTLGGPIREASISIDVEDDNLIYDRECFKKNKVWRRYDFYYRDRRVIVEWGVVVLDFDAHTPRVLVVMDALGWMEMAGL